MGWLRWRAVNPTIAFVSFPAFSLEQGDMPSGNIMYVVFISARRFSRCQCVAIQIRFVHPLAAGTMVG
jgi:hypothetical protein